MRGRQDRRRLGRVVRAATASSRRRSRGRRASGAGGGGGARATVPSTDAGRDGDRGELTPGHRLLPPAGGRPARRTDRLDRLLGDVAQARLEVVEDQADGRVAGRRRRRSCARRRGRRTRCRRASRPRAARAAGGPATPAAPSAASHSRAARARCRSAAAASRERGCLERAVVAHDDRAFDLGRDLLEVRQSLGGVHRSSWIAVVVRLPRRDAAPMVSVRMTSTRGSRSWLGCALTTRRAPAPAVARQLLRPTAARTWPR